MDIVKLSDVKEMPTVFLWKPYIPLGKITILEGLPGVGKTTLAAMLASVVTRGAGLEGFEISKPSKVLFLSPEDTPEDVLMPKIRLHEGDASLVNCSSDLLELEKAEDFDELANVICKIKPRLVVIDIFAYVKNTTKARLVLLKLSRLAAAQDCAILAIRHIIKRGHDLAIYQGMGNTAFSGVARSILLLTNDPSDTALCHLFHTKANCSETGPALTFEFLEEGKLSFMGPSRLSLADVQSKWSRLTNAVEDAQKFLKEILSAGPIAANTVYAEAAKRMIAQRTLNRAKKEMKVTTSKKGKAWFWSLIKATKVANAHLATLN